MKKCTGNRLCQPLSGRRQCAKRRYSCTRATWFCSSLFHCIRQWIRWPDRLKPRSAASHWFKDWLYLDVGSVSMLICPTHFDSPFRSATTFFGFLIQSTIKHANKESAFKKMLLVINRSKMTNLFGRDPLEKPSKVKQAIEQNHICPTVSAIRLVTSFS